MKEKITVSTIREEINRRVLARVRAIDRIEKDIDNAKREELQKLYTAHDCARASFKALDALLAWIDIQAEEE